LFAEAKFPMVGLERCQEKVDMINQGIYPIDGKEPGLAELLTRMVSEDRFYATTDCKVCREAQIVFVAVETPVDPVTKKSDYQVLRGALVDLEHNLSRGTMVIIESTIAPGTMDGVVKPILEATSDLQVNDRLKAGDFYLVNCPERVMPGKLLANIRGCHRVVGGMSPAAAEWAVKLYRYVVQADLDTVDCMTVELVETMESTMPVSTAYPWSWEAMHWFYDPYNARPFDMWPWQIWTSGVPLQRARASIIVLASALGGGLIASASWFILVVRRSL
jgi:UDP-N-acetyl-D-mannosaminuronic acid dehydrogenase